MIKKIIELRNKLFENEDYRFLFSDRRDIRILCSTILVGIGCLLLLNADTATVTEIDKSIPAKEISTTHVSGHKFFEWVGLFLMALSVWIWRKELKIESFGPFSGAKIEQRKPEAQAALLDDTEDANKITNFANSKPSAMVIASAEKSQRQTIMDRVKSGGSITSARAAQELGISVVTAKALLFKMVEEGVLRCDGFPRSAQFTSTVSMENLAIDRVRADLAQNNEITAERRFVRIDRMYDIDALFETNNGVYVVEIRRILLGVSYSALEKLVYRLIETARRLKNQQPHVFLALVVETEETKHTVSQWADRFTTESDSVPVRIRIYSKAEIEQGRRQGGDEF